jgi:hypothetical protein
LALFSETDLDGKVVGYLTSGCSAAEYERAYDFAIGKINSRARLRYEDADESTSVVLKGIGLELAMCHVVLEHFNEQTNPINAQVAWRLEMAISDLDQLAKGMITADADSDETTHKDVSMGVVLNADDEAVSKFPDTVTEYW